MHSPGVTWQRAIQRWWLFFPKSKFFRDTRLSGGFCRRHLGENPQLLAPVWAQNRVSRIWFIGNIGFRRQNPFRFLNTGTFLIWIEFFLGYVHLDVRTIFVLKKIHLVQFDHEESGTNACFALHSIRSVIPVFGWVFGLFESRFNFFFYSNYF